MTDSTEQEQNQDFQSPGLPTGAGFLGKPSAIKPTSSPDVLGNLAVKSYYDSATFNDSTLKSLECFSTGMEISHAIAPLGYNSEQIWKSKSKRMLHIKYGIT